MFLRFVSFTVSTKHPYLQQESPAVGLPSFWLLLICIQPRDALLDTASTSPHLSKAAQVRRKFLLFRKGHLAFDFTPQLLCSAKLLLSKGKTFPLILVIAKGFWASKRLLRGVFPLTSNSFKPREAPSEDIENNSDFFFKALHCNIDICNLPAPSRLFFPSWI